MPRNPERLDASLQLECTQRTLKSTIYGSQVPRYKADYVHISEPYMPDVLEAWSSDSFIQSG